jgi:hypothetical protein
MWWWLTCSVVIICSLLFPLQIRLEMASYLYCSCCSKLLVCVSATVLAVRFRCRSLRDIFFSSLLLYNGCSSYRLFFFAIWFRVPGWACWILFDVYSAASHLVLSLAVGPVVYYSIPLLCNLFNVVLPF